VQTGDLLSDISTLVRLWNQASVPTWVSVAWGLTTIASFAVPTLYLVGRIDSLNRAMYLELTLENVWQTLLGL